jgi:hypothetical protein
MRKNAYRTHQGWCTEVQFRPDIPRKVKRVLAEIANATYINKAKNTYSITHEELARRLQIDVSNVKRAVWWAIDNKWITVCVRGHHGRQQVYHRAVPWDAPRWWHRTPCPTCDGLFTLRSSVKARLVETEFGIVVDPATGEIIDVADLSRGAFSAQNRTPTRTPYIRTTAVLESVTPVTSGTDLVLLTLAESISAMSPGWPGWQFISRDALAVAA